MTKRISIIALLLLTACKGKEPQRQNKLGHTGPPYQIGENYTPAFTSASTYVHLMQTQVAAVYANSGGQPIATTCDDPLVNIQMRPTQNIEHCRVKMDSPDNAQVAVKFENGWAMLADGQGVRLLESPDQLPPLQ